MGTDRYEKMFRRLAEKGEGAFVPFAVAGDPNPDTGGRIFTAMVEAGADALEMGFPYSDPVADGSTIQKAHIRALGAGVSTAGCWRMVGGVRERFPDVPIGLLVYANIVEAAGLDRFYSMAEEHGADSVLAADVPTVEARPYIKAALRHGIRPVMIAAPNCTEEHLRSIASGAGGYTYVVTRAGVTGADVRAQMDHRDLIGKLEGLGAPPCLLGFGISRPEDVRGAMDAGAAGAISGSAVVQIIEDNLSDPEAMLRGIGDFVSVMKKATRRR
jgi:tryptophan synthase alpha chain